MTTITVDILPERLEDAGAIDLLHDRAFGPGRFARTAYRLREDVAHLLPLSFVARVGTLLVGSNRMSPVMIGDVPALLLGPLAVEPAFANRGIGIDLVRRSLKAAQEDGHRAVILVGDEAYYGKAGFVRATPNAISLPGPVDARRILVHTFSEDAASLAGAVTFS